MLGQFQLVLWLTGNDLISHLAADRLDLLYFEFHRLLVTDAVKHQVYNLEYIQHLEFLIISFAPKPFSTYKLV